MMRRIWNHLDKYRYQLKGFESRPGDKSGCFIIPYKNERLRVIATDGDYKSAGLSEEFAWEHVSVSLAHRCPTWEEMDFIKNQFWREDECVMQLHVPRRDHKNLHPYCLHLWRSLLFEIPRPPTEAVA